MTVIKKDLSKGKKYKCPFCDERLIRMDLVYHISEEHEDMIPEDSTATRLVFNLINKKDHGNCVICKRETPWNEDVSRYERYCIDNNGKCRDEGTRLAKENMKAKYGKTHLLDDPEMQIKMLGGRSISGRYEFADGEMIPYTGTYELHFLEFLDKVMKFNSSEIMSPGPVISYTYKGQLHYWIMDQYIPSYNLCIDVKDGGTNPNTRDMVEYREKQLAKEAAIEKQGQYNYIRLTDNNFAQLLSVLAELKMRLMEDNQKPFIKVNECVLEIAEFSSMGCAPMIGMNKQPEHFVIPYMRKGSFDMEYAVTDDALCGSIFTRDVTGERVTKGRKFLEEECEVWAQFKFNGVMDDFNNEPNFRYDENLGVYATVINNKVIMSPKQILVDDEYEQVASYKDLLDYARDCFSATLLHGSTDIPVHHECMHQDVTFFKDRNGYYAKNKKSGIRCESRNSIADIPIFLLDYINEGKL